MNQLLSILSQVPEFPQLLAAIDSGGCPAAVTGLAAVHRAHFAAGIRANTGRPVVLLCADETEAARLGGGPGRSDRGDGPSAAAQGVYLPQRRRGLPPVGAPAALRSPGHVHPGGAPLVVATVDALLQRTLPKTLLSQAAQTLRVGEVHDLPELARTPCRRGICPL